MVKGIVSTVLALLAFAALFAAGAGAAQEDLLAKARALVAEARPFIEKANDVDLELTERKAPRKEAFRRLKEARTCFDQYLDANPAQEDKLDKEYVEMMVLLHAIKKDSAISELEKDDDDSGPAAPPAPAPAPSTPPAGEPAAPTPAAPEPSARAKEALGKVRDFEKAHPGNLPEAQRLYTRFLADFADPALPEYVEAADRLGKISERMKSVFQTAVKRDYDTLVRGDSKDEQKVMTRLTSDLNSKDPETRRRAARLLATIRHRSATFFLARGANDRDEEFAKACREGLVLVGGTSAGESLVKLYRDTPKEKQHLAMDLFAEIVKKGPFEQVNQSRSIGRFTLSNEGPVALRAFELLTSLGKLGGPGLVVALDSRDPEKKKYAIQKIAEARYYKGAAVLASRYLVPGQGEFAVLLRNAATKAIEDMGVYTVPYLIDALSGTSGRVTGVVLSKLTGLEIEAEEKQKVRDWWAGHKPADAE